MSSDDQRPQPDEDDERDERGEGAEGAEPGPGDGPGRRGTPPRPLVLAAAALALAAFAVAVAFGVRWAGAAQSDELAIAQTREDVVAAAGHAATVFTEFDHERADELLAERKRISSESMRREVEETEQQWRDSIAQAELKTTSVVEGVAVEELNLHEGKARVLAVIRVDVANSEGEFSKIQRLQLNLEQDRQGDEQDAAERPWTVSAVSDVRYGASG
ncbi:hypothetical protein FFT09_10305 [Saccharomonospora piscinae]|uniref:hypothetical protein n=1 Tax=Saccharomonospora piscinae TaxID=687388 RepID=UPI0011072CE1|nr:hypothetical protein [Saccharomonospora piscinae]TLW93744.1 hypothetical protein FFT09_10305 [Saccharomonospora piscinae]